jgi:hypothetical protein
MRPIVLTLLLFTFFTSFGQNTLKGKWYTFSFDMFKVVEYNFDTAIFVSNKLDWELKDQPGTQTARIVKTSESRGNLYYLLQNTADTSVIILSIFSSVKPGQSFVEATASEEHSTFNSVEDALAFINTDTISRPGLIFYSQKEFEKLRSLPDVLTISKEGYKNYLQGLIEEREKFKKFASQHNDDFGFMFFMVYLPNQARKVIASLGYNPVIDDQHLERVNDKFRDDVTLKDLMKKALEVE